MAVHVGPLTGRRSPRRSARGRNWDLSRSLLVSYGVQVESVTIADAEWAAQKWVRGEGSPWPTGCAWRSAADWTPTYGRLTKPGELAMGGYGRFADPCGYVARDGFSRDSARHRTSLSTCSQGVPMSQSVVRVDERTSIRTAKY